MQCIHLLPLLFLVTPSPSFFFCSISSSLSLSLSLSLSQDFGDYYYSVQTTEGETISQLISDYFTQKMHIHIKPEPVMDFEVDQKCATDT